jgi:hypothetical protein
MARPNKRVYEIMNTRFKELLTDEALSNVGYSSNGAFTSYSMFEYAEEWAKFARIVSKKLEEEAGEDIFTRKYNRNLLATLKNIVYNISAQDVSNAQERFKTYFLDGM